METQRRAAAPGFVDKQHCHRSLLLVVAQARSIRSRLPHCAGAALSRSELSLDRGGGWGAALSFWDA